MVIWSFYWFIYLIFKLLFMIKIMKNRRHCHFKCNSFFSLFISLKCKKKPVALKKLLHLITNMFVCLVVFNATFNNISVISWQSVLLVEETGGSGENHRPVASHWQIYHIMLYTSPWSKFELTTLVVIGTGCIGSCKSNYHTITATTAPLITS